MAMIPNIISKLFKVHMMYSTKLISPPYCSVEVSSSFSKTSHIKCNNPLLAMTNYFAASLFQGNIWGNL